MLRLLFFQFSKYGVWLLCITLPQFSMYQVYMREVVL